MGISATTPTDFIERAKGIVCSHNDLQKKRGGLEQEIRRLEQDQEALIARKEKEILDSVLASKAGGKQEVNLAELRAMVKSDIRACLEASMDTEKVTSPLPRVGNDVTLTKVPGERARRDEEVRKEEEEGRRREEDEGRKRAEGEQRKRLEEEQRRLTVEVRRRGEEEGRRREEEMRRKEDEMKSNNSEHSSPGSYSAKKVLATPRAQDDYEDRFKKIISTELSREINKMPLETPGEQTGEGGRRSNPVTHQAKGSPLS